MDKNNPRFMSPEQKQIVDLILSNNEIKSGKDVSVVFNELRGKVIQTLLEAEMDEFLGYNKNSHESKKMKTKETDTLKKSKKVKTDCGEITVCLTRDRKGEFEPKIVNKRQKILEGFDDIAIAMYAKGMTLKDISDMIRKIYKVDLSIETISNLTSAVSEKVQSWQNRKLENFYPFVYIDCLYAPVKKDLISEKTAIYVMLGINRHCRKEVMGIWNNVQNQLFELFGDRTLKYYT